MNTKFILVLAVAAFAGAAFAHERITLGPRGGRVIYLDSQSVPNVEFMVKKDGRAEIALLDKNRKPIAPGEQSIAVTAGPRASAKKLKVEKQGDTYITEPVPEGAPYTVVIQVKEKPEAKALTGRVNYNPAPAKSGKPEYLDDSVNEGSGPNIKIPDALDGLFAEINQHYAELQENLGDKKYEALDEVTLSFTALLKALPAKSGDKSAAVQPQVDALVKELAAIGEANAARNLSAGKTNLASFNTAFAALKKNYPEKTASAKKE
jgi:hypothetical protein